MNKKKITKLKEIKKMVGESSQEYDEKFQNFINKISYTIHETQQKELSIHFFFLFNGVPLMQ